VNILVVLIVLMVVSAVLTSASLYLGVSQRLREVAGDAALTRRSQSRRPVSVPGMAFSLLFDRLAVRTAAGEHASVLRQETVIGDLTYVLRDAGQRRLDILVVRSGAEAETAAEPAMESEVLPITVVSSGDEEDYFLIFAQEASGQWVARLTVPGLADRVAIAPHPLREAAALTADDAAAVARSVRAVPGPWRGQWVAVAQTRPEGDPVREAIERAR
jgi:hypothetical protein